MSPRVVVAVLAGSLLAVVVVASCATSGKGGKGGADPAKGAVYFQTKCQACHPNGGAGPALLGKTPPGPLKKSSAGGRHNVPDSEYDSLIAYITPIMVPGAAAAAGIPAGASPATAGAAAPPATTTAAPAAAAPPMAAQPGMKTCNCTCQCPANTPPGQMSACTCQCSCPN